MSNTNTVKRLSLANIELNKRIALLEEKFLEKNIPEKALPDSEKRYRRLFESAKDGILILDADTGKVVDVNPFLLQLLGYSYDSLCGQHIWELGAFKDIAASKEAFKALQDNEYIRYEDLPLETFDGHPIAVEFVSNVYLMDYDKVIQCNIRDITERKRADAERKQLETEIKDAREYAENIVETLREPLMVLNSDLKIITANQSFYNTFKVTSEETIGNFIYDIGNRQWDILKLRLLFKDILSDNTQFHSYEVEHDFLYIGRKTIMLNARQILRENMGLRTILLAMEDITDRKRAEEERERLIAELQKALSEIKILSGLLPICASCKNIRDDKGYWKQIESYIQDHSEVEFSHGMCPDCRIKLYPELNKNKPEAEKN